MILICDTDMWLWSHIALWSRGRSCQNGSPYDATETLPPILQSNCDVSVISHSNFHKQNTHQTFSTQPNCHKSINRWVPWQFAWFRLDEMEFSYEKSPWRNKWTGKLELASRVIFVLFYKIISALWLNKVFTLYYSPSISIISLIWDIRTLQWLQ